ncbi:MAG: hypothetical protein V3V31_01235, partial [Methylococcales bacterium]
MIFCLSWSQHTRQSSNCLIRGLNLTLHYRRFLLSKFLFSVVYRENERSIFVVAVMHNSRKPNYWKNCT